MKTSPRTILFFIVMLAYLLFPAWQIITQENTLSKGTVYRFQPQPVDPLDVFRGRYITLSYEGLNVDFPNAKKELFINQKVYASLKTDADGFTIFDKISLVPFEDRDYIQTTLRNIYKDKVRLKVPDDMGRYFMNEKLAPLAEKAYNELLRNNNLEEVNVYVEVRVLEGKALIQNIYMEGMLMEDYLREGLIQPQ